MHEKQTVMFRTVNGNVTINEALRKPEQSKDIIKRFRLEPQDDDKIKDLCFENEITFSEFQRTASELLIKQFKNHKKLLNPENDKVLNPVLEILPE